MEKDDKRSWIIENFYPLVISIIISVACSVVFRNIKIEDDVNSILSAVLNFTAIIIGFLGVVISILFGSPVNSIVVLVMGDSRYKKLLKRYFFSAIISGFILILFTIIIFFRVTIDAMFENVINLILFILKFGWLFFLVYFSLSSYRVISVIMKIAFRDNPVIKEDDEEIDEEKYEKMKKEKNISK